VDAGDEGMGTGFWLKYGMTIVHKYMNLLQPAAWVVGNHDFDSGEKPLGEAIDKFTFPALGANVQTKNEYLEGRLKPYTVIEEHRLVIIGLTTQKTKGTSRADPDTDFEEPIEMAEKILLEVQEKYENYRIMLLSHLGYELDLKLAEKTSGISVIVGGHSHTGLGGMIGTGNPPSEGDYPTLIKKKGKLKTCIVQAAM
jgi:5'-nucleotidase